jgi:hypothetical protein
MAGTEAANCTPIITVRTDTTEIHSEPLVIDEHLIIRDTVIIEKVIEKTFPKAMAEEKGDYGKIAAAFFTFVFVIMSIIWKRKHGNNG